MHTYCATLGCNCHGQDWNMVSCLTTAF